MAPGSKTTHLICVLLLVHLLSVEGVHEALAPVQSLRKVGLRIGSRKVLALDTVLDYDYAGPNPKHDPRKGRPPGGRNP